MRRIMELCKEDSTLTRWSGRHRPDDRQQPGRPGLQRALFEARTHRYELLLVYRVDRLARSVRGLAEILHDLDKAGMVFRSATEPFDTGSPAGRMMVQMLRRLRRV